MIGVPCTLKRYLVERSFQAVDKATRQTRGQVLINSHGSSFGYFPFLRRSGADAGDVLLAEFDLARETVTLSLEGEAALDDDAAISSHDADADAASPLVAVEHSQLE